MELASTDAATNTDHDKVGILKDKCQEELAKIKKMFAECQKNLHLQRNNFQQLRERNIELEAIRDNLLQQPLQATTLALQHCTRNNFLLQQEKDQLHHQLHECSSQLRHFQQNDADRRNIAALSQSLQQSAAAAGRPNTNPFASTPAPTGVAALRALQRGAPSEPSLPSDSDESSVHAKSQSPNAADPVTEPVRFMHNQTIAGMGIADIPAAVNQKQFLYDNSAIPVFTGNDPKLGINKWLQCVTSVTNLAGLLPTVKAGLMYTKLSGSAKTVIDTLFNNKPEARDDPRAISAALLARFNGQAAMTRLHTQLSNLKQASSVATFNNAYSEILNEMGGCKPLEPLLLEIRSASCRQSPTTDKG